MSTSDWLRWGGFVGYMVLIFIVSAIPGNTLSETGLFHHDKLLHLLEYGVLGVLCGWVVIQPGDLTAANWVEYALAIGIGWLFAVSDEIHQYFVPGRMMELNDFIADAAGIILGVLLYRFILAKYLRRIENAV
ncbi:MAG: hypothetical protein MAGBODY4_00731 [Candidatus Marinimicrobia bacterium]|nr:hypothetical protein [Candidatus Neomarinimicrobiota bacterium]